jgi:hypothetical protein
MSEETSNQETATKKQHADAEFRRGCYAIGLCADDVALIMAVDKPTGSRARR